MNVKKIIAGAGILLMIFSSISAKTKKSDKKSDKNTSSKIKIVATTFPEYDWARELTKDVNSAELTLLVGNGMDLHSYQPSVQDIVRISTADIFIYVGGESDAWVKDALKNATNKNMKVINLMEVLGDRVKEEEIKEGMQAEDDEHHEDVENEQDEDHGDDEDDDKTGQNHHHHEGEIEYDEHVWLSVKNAKIFCREITDALIEKDSANASKYNAKLSEYTEKLDALDAEFAAAVKKGSKKTILFGDRFPFRYFVEDYNLDYFAAFAGCSAETEASFETIIFLTKKLDELGLGSVLKIETGDGKIARTIIQNSKNKNAKVLSINSIQSTTAKQAANGESYLKIMNENLKVIEEALK